MANLQSTYIGGQFRSNISQSNAIYNHFYPSGYNSIYSNIVLVPGNTDTTLFRIKYRNNPINGNLMGSIFVRYAIVGQSGSGRHNIPGEFNIVVAYDSGETPVLSITNHNQYSGVGTRGSTYNINSLTISSESPSSAGFHSSVIFNGNNNYRTYVVFHAHLVGTSSDGYSSGTLLPITGDLGLVPPA